MSSYTVTVIVQETLEKVIKVNVECDESDDAKERVYNAVWSKYKECEIVLCDTDFQVLILSLSMLKKTK